MKRRASDLEPELEALLTPRKIQGQLPPELRARVLAWARATLAGDVVPPVPPLHVRPTRGALRRRLLPIALAASFAIAGAAVGAVAALHGRVARKPQVPPDDAPALSLPVTRGATATTELPSTAAREPARPSHPAHPGPKGDPFTAELDLVQRAHAAYTGHEFSVALTLIAEHARRFPRGNLAEQREALRVRSLLGAGRAEEAHRAAASFAVRFPRSVLLTRVAGGWESPQP
jgi:hypothetical protein